jgi:hypothetical protein
MKLNLTKKLHMLKFYFFVNFFIPKEDQNHSLQAQNNFSSSPTNERELKQKGLLRDSNLLGNSIFHFSRIVVVAILPIFFANKNKKYNNPYPIENENA